jgi:hypothetical protein
MKHLAYSMDALIPGLYIWLGFVFIRIGGCKAEKNYPSTIKSLTGVCLVLPGYKIYTTYKENYTV